MIIDTIMALWNRILTRKLKKVVITSSLLGIGLVLLLVMIGISTFPRPSKISQRTVPYIDLADKKEHAVSKQIYLDGLSTPPSTSAEPATPTPTVVQPTPTVVPTPTDEQKQPDQAPLLIPSLPSHVPATIFYRAPITHQVAPQIKRVKPTTTPRSSFSSPTSVLPELTVVPTPMLEELPTPPHTESNSQTPIPAPLPTITVIVPTDLSHMPESVPTPISTHGSLRSNEIWIWIGPQY